MTLVVTGASSDVGAALIGRVADNYDTIICHYRSSTAIIESLQTKFGDKVIPVQADFSDLKSTERFVETALAQGGDISHMVHLSSSSSSSVNKKFSKTLWTQFETEIDITFRSAVMCCQAFIPPMVKAGYGKVVMMLSSQMVWEPAKPYSTAYTCTKHALHGLVKSLAAEYAAKGVTVNGVSPSMIDTKFLRVPDIVKEVNISNSPIKRLLTVDDVVPAFEFLLSSGADTVTGQNIAVTAGN
ncbi:MAG: SDR family oxidoreductase [Oscillospiraceae bacterium]|jgi:3-oxoacyl-[acyl-carrier protein] reductase|nr:SDR family oxidoreductase [Oscillospiraceae bacterium]